LATKYCVPKIRRKGLDILRKPFPVTLEEYDDASWQPLWNSISVGRLAKTFALAREIQVLDILPFAFFALARLEVDSVLRKARTSLSSEDLLVCLAGRCKILQIQKSHSLSFAYNFVASPRCLAMNVCQRQQPSHVIWQLHKDGFFTEIHALDRMEPKILGFCSECTADAACGGMP
jgi:hypothetical protein